MITTRKLATLALAAAIASGLSSVAHAEDIKTDQIIQGLGHVLGSEQACGLTYNQDAIVAFVKTNAPPDDINFAGMLETYAQSEALGFQGMSASTKAAVCAQVETVARHYGFLDRTAH